MKVSSYMTRKLVTASPYMPLEDALLTMLAENFRHLPVVEEGRLIGILSDRDLRRPQWADPLDDWTACYQLSEDLTVADLMTKNPETVHTYDDIRKAVRIIRERRYGALPVLDKTGDLVGILSAIDLLAALESLLT